MIKNKGALLLVIMLFITGILSCGGARQQTQQQGTLDDGNVIMDKKLANRGKAKGTATIFDNNTALARDRALNDARNKLVENILGSMVYGSSLMQNYELVSTVVKSESSGMIKNENVIDEGKIENLYHVTIEGSVEKSAVEDAIGKAIERYGKPKMMILVKEDFIGTNNKPGFTQTEMVIGEKFGDLGFEFVDVGITKKLMKEQGNRMSKAIEGQMGDDVKDLLLGGKIADIVILGTADTTDQSESIKKYNPNMNSHMAVINLKAVDVYTGNQFAAVSRKASGVFINPKGASIAAIEKTLEQILGKKDASGKFQAGPFLEGIIKKFTKAATNREIQLLITGLDRDGLTKFRNEVQQRVRGVNNIMSRGQIGQAGKLDVYFTGQTDEFLDELKSLSESLGFDIKITESFPNKATIQAKLRQ